MRQIAICMIIALTLGAALVLGDFHENIVLVWAGLTTIVATSIR